MGSRYIFFLGRQASLTAAELWRWLYWRGYQPRFVAGTQRWLLATTSKKLEPSFIDEIGGTSRIAQVIDERADPPTADTVATLLSPPPAKCTFGISAIGLESTFSRQMSRQLKSILKQQGSRAKFVTTAPGTSQLNTAQVLFNALHRQPNFELTFLRYQNRFVVARTVAVQDIQGYERRDTSRPVRLRQIGLLPPKLAQIMLNLAVSQLPAATLPTILDPFCGMGTILQEGWLKGWAMVGLDIDSRMLDAAGQNLRWLSQQRQLLNRPQPILFQHDVKKPFAERWHGTVDAVVTEPYLGRPLHAPLSANQAKQAFKSLRPLYLALLKNVQPVLRPSGVVLLALPVFRQSRGGTAQTASLPNSFLDEGQRLGYTLSQLFPQELSGTYQPTPRGTLIYARPDALVGRELTLWIKR